MASGARLTARVEIGGRDRLAQPSRRDQRDNQQSRDTVVERVSEGNVQLLSTSSEIPATADGAGAGARTLQHKAPEYSPREISATSESLLAGAMEEVKGRRRQSLRRPAATG